MNSPFFPAPYIEAEPGQAKRRVQDNLHAHVQNAAIFPPKIGEKSYMEVLSLLEDQLKEIAKYGISGKKLHEGLAEDESVDVGEGKFKILFSSPES